MTLKSCRIIQLTDCHLMVDPTAQLKGICTRDEFDRVLKKVCSGHGGAERLVVTGDLTHDEQLATYESLRESLAPWLSRLRVVPGNHDDRTAMRQVFADRVELAAERIVFADEVAGWRLIGLDSHVPGELHGQLGSDQLDWLDQLLQQNRNPTCVFMHHPPIRMQSEWLDRIGLVDADELQATIQRHAHVRLVCTGHVHQERTANVGQTTIVTSPSTGVQFRPQTNTLEIDDVPPGYRVIELFPKGEFNTWIERVIGGK